MSYFGDTDVVRRRRTFSLLSILLLSWTALTECTGPNVSIVISPADITVDAGSTVAMVCIASGSPTPSIGWDIDNTSVTSCTSSRHTIHERTITTSYNLTFTESILEICSIEPEESGQYLCTARNEVGSASAANRTNIVVESEPTYLDIVVTTPSETVSAGSTILLICMAYGTPQLPSITWQFNGTSITNCTFCRYSVYERTITSQNNNITFTESILEICGIGLEDSGEYLCMASNGDKTVSAPNATVLTVLSNVPSRPDSCSTVPVYNAGGELVYVNFTWSKVDTPEEMIPGSNTTVNITNYIVSVEGLGSHSIPAETIACQESSSGTCSYLYPIQPASSLPASTSGRLHGHVAAESDVGHGRMCSPPGLQPNNQPTSYLKVTTTNDAITAACSQLSNCEICYWLANTATSSCQQQPRASMTCVDIPGGDRTDLSAFLEDDGTYCYRATAIVDGKPVVTQDTFNKHPISAVMGSSLGTGSQVFPIAVSASSVGGLILGIVFGALVGACITHLVLKQQIRKHYTLSRSNTLNSKGVNDCHHNTDYEDMDTVRANYLELSTNEAYGSPSDIGKNEAYGSVEQGEDDVYDTPSNGPYDKPDDPALDLYDND